MGLPARMLGPEEAMGEAHVPAEEPEAGQEAWLPAPDVHPSGAGHNRRPSSQGPAQAVGLIRPVTDRATFASFRCSPRRVRRGPVAVTFVPEDGGEPVRVAYAVGRRVGGAVQRNRLRRRLRAVVSELGDQLHAGAYLVSAGPEAKFVSFGELREEVARAIADVHRGPDT